MTSNEQQHVAGNQTRVDALRARMGPRLFQVQRPRWCVSPSDWEGRQRLIGEACDLFLELKAAKIVVAGRQPGLSTPVLRAILPLIEHEIGGGGCFGLTQSHRAFRAMVKEKQAKIRNAAAHEATDGRVDLIGDLGAETIH